jgi:nicotinamidase-related amidase
MSEILDAKESAILVIDMQKDFCYSSGSLFVEWSKKIVDDLNELLKRGRERGVSIAFTQDWHSPDDPEFSVWGKHCVARTTGAEIIDELPKGGHKIKSRHYNKFEESDLDSYLKQRKIKNLLFTGVFTNMCVLYTATDATTKGYRVIILKNCVAAPSDYEHEYGLYHLSLLKAEITTSKDIKFE